MLIEQYDVYAHVQASVGVSNVIIGEKGVCRYCGTTDSALFRSLSHTFPEALGNKWVFSRDECDQCNKLIFSKYDDALANCVAPLLTLGGTKGKGNVVRQTGRTNGQSTIRRHRTFDNRPGLSIHTQDPDFRKKLSYDVTLDEFGFTASVAPLTFKPRYAYKALAKMGCALLPEGELKNYSKLLQWLQTPDDSIDFPMLPVGLSFGTVGNAPPLVCGALLRRKNPEAPIPRILFLFCAGSVCLQIDLKSDHLEDHVPPSLMGAIDITFSVVLGDSTSERSIKIEYGKSRFFNWSSGLSTPQPVKEIVIRFNRTTSEGRIIPIFRQ